MYITAGAIARTLSGHRRPAVVALALALFVLAPAAARAGVGASAIPTFPTAVTVGNTGVPGSVELRNTDTDTNAADTNTVCNFGDPSPCPAGDPGITFIPACGALGAFSVCASPDPGVFRISDTAAGEAGTECAGMGFNVSLADPASGQVRFTPQGAAHVTLHGAGSACRIAFAFSVLKLPTLDQNPGSAGVQTVQVTDNTQFSGFNTASARGTSVGTTVSKATPTIATTASPDVPLGGQIGDTATVGGLVSPAGGTVTFRAYGPNDATCAQAPAFESPNVPVAANGTATSGPFKPKAPGVYRWRASFSGDANNDAVAGACNDASESVTVARPPSVTVLRTNRTGGSCTETTFKLRVKVSGSGLSGVRVTLDGKTIATSRRSSFSVKVRPHRLRRGRHTLRVTATGAGGRVTRTTTFRRCGRAELPRFVG